MRFLFFVGCLVLAIAAQVCSGRPQDPAYGTDVEQDYVVPKDVQLSRHTWDEEDHEEYIIDTLKDISKTLREKFLLLAEKIKEKMTALRQAAGARASLLKEQLSDLKHQLEVSTGILKQKVQDLFDKGQYATMGDNALETFAKLYELRGRLNKFVHGMKDMTGEKLEKLAELVRELRHKIEKKVQELMYGSSGTDVALYYGSDEIDDEAYVIQTLRDISRTLKEKFLLLGEHMKQKLAELKEIGGRHAEVIKEQLKELKGKLAIAREELKQKVQKLFDRAQYASFGENAVIIISKIFDMRARLNDFIEAIKNVTGEKLQALKGIIKELRLKIKEKVRELLHGSAKPQTALYSSNENDAEAYIIGTLRDIAKTLKKKFLVLVQTVKDKLSELMRSVGKHAKVIKEQLQKIFNQLNEARKELQQKLAELFTPSPSMKKHAEEIFAKLKKLRAKFAVFVKEVKNITVEKAQKLMKMIVELRDEIKQEISQLLKSTHSYALYQASDDDEDKEAYIIDTLKSISATLKEKFLTLGENIRQKLIELKGASGEQAKAIKKQLTNLRNQLSESVQALKRKVADIFNTAHYTSFGSNALEVFAKLFDLREKLSNFIKVMKTVTGEKLEKLQVLIKELREDIKKKVQELLHGSSESPSALYQESDDAEDDEAYIIDTLKSISVALKERFATLVEKIRQKLLELKGTAGEQTKAIKEQLQNFKNQLSESRQALQQKVAAIFERSQYASFGSNGIEVVAKLFEIREKLNSFIEAIKTVTGEKLEKLKGLIRELRQEIKEKVQELLRGSSEAPNSLYQVSNVDEDNENYIMKTLKDISQSLKERFIILIDKIKEIVVQLKTTAGEQVQVLQTRLQVLRTQLGEARRELMKKVKEFLTPSQYFDYGGKTNEFAENLLAFRWKLEYLMNELKTDDGENYGEVKDLIESLGNEINDHVHQCMGSSSVSASALYQANVDDDQNDKRAYVINTLKDIAKSLKDKFLNIGEKIRQKLAELKTAAGAQVVRVQEQLKELAKQMFKAREELREKLKELVRPKQTQYAYLNDHGSDIFSKITHVKEKLASFLKRMKDLTGETLAKLRTEVGELREAIKQQISQLLHGSDNTPALYLAIEDIEDNKAYIIDTLKDISKTLKEKFMVLGEKIGLKMDEMRQAAGLRAAILKKQLQELKGQLIQARDAVKLKLWEIIRPGQSAQYSLISDMSSSVFDKLSALRDKLQTFLNKLQATAGEGWTKMQDKIRDLRKEIKEGIQNMLRQKPWITTTVASTMLPSTATPVPALQTVDQEK
ncbi:unnamed protein product [Ixodes persulcatus]